MPELTGQARSLTYKIIGIAFLVLFVLAGFFGYRIAAAKAASAPRITRTIPETVLEEQYGLKVNLVAVTAGSGMLDVRLKVLDAQKAHLLFQDQNDYPLFIAGKEILRVPEESQQSLKDLENGGMLFILAPNTHKAVQPNKLVTIVIGETRIEPINAK